jgi:hypothetical protein
MLMGRCCPLFDLLFFLLFFTHMGYLTLSPHITLIVLIMFASTNHIILSNVSECEPFTRTNERTN